MIEFPGFTQIDDCAAIIAAYERSRARCAHESGGEQAFFSRRVMWINEFPDEENLARRLLQRLRRRAVCVLSAHYMVPLYSDTIQVVRWDVGQAMAPHADDRHPDGRPHGTPWRAYASIIYLNDGYAGGDLYFPGGKSYQPVAGSLVAFPGEWVHGVHAVTAGVRYTAPGWYSLDPANEDPYARVEY